jgi:hypothetical protein
MLLLPMRRLRQQTWCLALPSSVSVGWRLPSALAKVPAQQGALLFSRPSYA